MALWLVRQGGEQIGIPRSHKSPSRFIVPLVGVGRSVGLFVFFFRAPALQKKNVQTDNKVKKSGWLYILLRPNKNFVFHNQNGEDQRYLKSPYPEEIKTSVLFYFCSAQSPPSPHRHLPLLLFVVRVCVCVCLCVCVCVCVYPFLWEGQSLVWSPRVFHMQISHIGPSTQAFTWTCYWSSALWQNPLVQCGWLTGHQLLSADTKLAGCRGCWLGRGFEGSVYSGRVWAVSKHPSEIIIFFGFWVLTFCFFRKRSAPMSILLIPAPKCKTRTFTIQPLPSWNYGLYILSYGFGPVVYHTQLTTWVPYGSSVGCKYGYRVGFFMGSMVTPPVFAHICWKNGTKTKVHVGSDAVIPIYLQRYIFILCHLLSPYFWVTS